MSIVKQITKKEAGYPHFRELLVQFLVNFPSGFSKYLKYATSMYLYRYVLVKCLDT